MSSTLLSSTGGEGNVLTVNTRPSSVRLNYNTSLTHLTRGKVCVTTIIVAANGSNASKVVSHRRRSHGTLGVLKYRRAVRLGFTSAHTRLRLGSVVSTLRSVVGGRVPSSIRVVQMCAVRSTSHRRSRLTICRTSVITYHAVPRVLNCRAPDA